MVRKQKSKEKIEFINKVVNKKSLSKLVLSIYDQCGAATTAEVANALKQLGFHYATRAGVTLGIEDLVVPDDKKELLRHAEKEIDEAQKRYECGEITEVERYRKVIDTWSDTTQKLTDRVVENFDHLNPVYMMAFSGARGNISQVRQLVGMRGLMADSQGQIIDLPIKSNFKEGLTVTEYIISSYGARKGLVDTALKTADSGYLTRRLVDVAQDVTIRSHDCGTKFGVVVHTLYEGDKIILAVGERVIGRVAAEDICKPGSKSILVKRNELLDTETVRLLEEANILSVKVRSPFGCELEYGICQLCYGWSLATNTMVDIGEAIGIIAAQSIGEPGTQLTMRTFHTGGVVSGAGGKLQILAKAGDTIKYDISTREVRNRYGEKVEQTTRDGKLHIGSAVVNLPAGSHLKYSSGYKVQETGSIGEFAEQQKGITERATKDIISDYAGQIIFDGFSGDERRDRQGNISRTANKSGTIWVMQGDVYNLPGGAKLTVEDGGQVKQENVLAESLIISERGGEVRFGDEMVIDETKSGKQIIKRLIQGREVSIVIAKVGADNAKFESTKQGYAWKVKGTKNNPEENYTIKVVPEETLENKSVIAELIDDGALSVASAGEIRYLGLEIDDSRIITQPGKVMFIPEEVHYVSKDVNLKLVENWDKVQAGQEIVQEVFTQLNGVVEFKIDNDIIHEIVVRPGEMHDIPDPAQLNCDDGEIVKGGTEIYPGIAPANDSMITIIESEKTVEEGAEEERSIRLIVRPVYIYDVEPKKVFFQGYSTDANIALVAVTQMLFRDGERVRKLHGGPLCKTSLVLTMGGDMVSLKGQVEINENQDGKEELQIIVKENIVLRREQDTNVTQLLVNDHDHIAPGVALAKTQVLAKSNGLVSLSTQEEKRLLLITGPDLIKQEVSGKVSVKNNDFVKHGEKISSQTGSHCSGQVVNVDSKSIVIRKGRPYLVSYGALLTCDQGHLVQRGDQLASLVYERMKSSDIVQGLPRVEELLEGRRPKDAAILADINGKVKVVQQEDIKQLLLTSGDMQKEVIIPPGLNVIVEDGQEVTLGQPLTDGSPNPSELLSLLGIEALQGYLLDEVQKVYRSQGVEISDKHVEIIIRQMTRKVRIEDPGDTILLPGELVELRDIQRETQKAQELISKDAKPPIYKAVLLGITKASLNTDSFISAASFQETTRILSEASIQGKKDWLMGLKENVIVGRLIPAGTGFIHSMHAEARSTGYGDNFMSEPAVVASTHPSLN